MGTSLYAPESYAIADDLIKGLICNGCGAKGLGGWVVPNTMYGLSIKEACNIHDWMYNDGKTFSDKEVADRTFLNNMLRIIDGADHFGSAILRPFRRIRAMSYFTAVKRFGGLAFWSGKNKPQEMLIV